MSRIKSTNQMNDFVKKIAHIMEKNPDCIYNDLLLTLKYWVEFEPFFATFDKKSNTITLNVDKVFAVTVPETIRRSRQIIQSEFEMFVPDKEEKKRRRRLWYKIKKELSPHRKSIDLSGKYNKIRGEHEGQLPLVE